MALDYSKQGLSRYYYKAKQKEGKQTYKERLAPLRDKRVVFIFDECHRSQFGDNHKAIKEFFPRAQLFGWFQFWNDKNYRDTLGIGLGAKTFPIIYHGTKPLARYWVVTEPTDD